MTLRDHHVNFSGKQYQWEALNLNSDNSMSMYDNPNNEIRYKVFLFAKKQRHQNAIHAV